MSDDRAIVDSECPLLRPTRPVGTRGRLSGMYCRFPDGRVRVPAEDERERFCLIGQWQECPTYQRHAPAAWARAEAAGLDQVLTLAGDGPLGRPL
jgi:hypothetical protein